MEHTELIDALGKRLGSRQDAVDALDALIEVIVREVATGGRVALSGFGVFDTSGSGGRVAPQPRFRAGSVFNELVAQSGAPVPHPIETHEEGAEGEGQTQPGQRRAPTTGDAARLLPHAAPARVGSLHFSHYDLPAGVSLSAVLPEDSPRCGIYVLCFDDGQFYVGQARDVLGRFADHRRRWTDRITGLDFAPALLKDLNDLERRVIQRFEREDRHLINSALVGLPMGESPLDVFVDRVEQERWLDEPAEAAYDLIGERVALAAGRHRTGVKYHQLSRRDDYQSIRGALFGYLMEVVPWPHETERRFWSMTSLPSTKRSRDGRRLSVVTVNKC